MTYYGNGDYIYHQVGHILHKKYPDLKPPEITHRGLHRLFRSEKADFYIIFKKAKFLSFSSQFKDFVSEYPEYEGIGESVNMEVIDTLCTNHKSHLIICYNQDEIYITYPRLIRNFCLKHKLVREQEVKNTIYGNVIKEKTYSFPINILTDFKGWIKE